MAEYFMVQRYYINAILINLDDPGFPAPFPDFQVIL